MKKFRLLTLLWVFIEKNITKSRDFFEALLQNIVFSVNREQLAGIS